MVREELARREAAGTPIRVGVVGGGPFGLWLTSQIAQVPGMIVTALADHTPEKALKIWEAYGRCREDVVVAEKPSTASDAVARGKAVIVPEGNLVPECPVDVVVDVTGYPESCASVGYRTIMAGKHLVSMNVEGDCLLGPILRRMADAAGVTYNIGAGDQPANCKELFDYIKVLGLEVVAIGLGEGRRSDEQKRLQMERAIAMKSRNKIGSADGTKNQIEMCCIANMTGLPPEVRGMHFVATPSIADIPRYLCPKADGGILESTGVINHVECNPMESLHQLDSFAVVTSANEVALDVFRTKGLFTSANGKYAMLYKTNHMVGLETPWTIAQAVVTGQSSTASLPNPVAEVVAIAKRDLKVGEELDSVGGLAVRGAVERFDVARKENLLPLGLCQNVRMGRDVAKGAALTYGDLAAPGTSFAWTLRRLQDLTTPA